MVLQMSSSWLYRISDFHGFIEPLPTMWDIICEIRPKELEELMCSLTGSWQVVKQGWSVAPHTITQIAPTLSMLLDIPLPDASDRRPIGEIFE